MNARIENAQIDDARRLMAGSERTEELLEGMDLGLTDDDVALLTLDLDRLSHAVRRVARVSEATGPARMVA